MSQPDPMSTQHSPSEQYRYSGAARTFLITWGIAAYTLLLPSSDLKNAPQLLGAVSPHSIVLAGLGLQCLLVGVRMLVKRYAPDHGSALQGMSVLSIIGDGVTVLLFALGTLTAILPAADNI